VAKEEKKGLHFTHEDRGGTSPEEDRGETLPQTLTGYEKKEIVKTERARGGGGLSKGGTDSLDIPSDQQVLTTDGWQMREGGGVWQD